jgi:enolase-phosphatase E1
MQFSGRGILLDIEGTTSSVSFVYDQMFPYARRELRSYLQTHWGEDALARACEQVAQDAGWRNLSAWCDAAKTDQTRQLVESEVLRLMDQDVKATGLKALQGMIWQEGFVGGELKAHVFPDVPPALESWNSAGLDVRIYSSGSIQAQKLFFGHADCGDLLHFFRGHYDTTTGSKKDSASYKTIAEDYGLPARDVLFLSDIPAELDAARTAGMQTGLCVRPGNAPVPPGHGHAEMRAFDELRLVK